MARRTTREGRLLAILDISRTCRALTCLIAFAVVLIVGPLALPTAMMKASKAQTPASAATPPASQPATAPVLLSMATIPDVATFADLLSQPAVRVGDWDCRVGVADPGEIAGPIRQLYCLADWKGVGEAVNGSGTSTNGDALGPLKLLLNWDGDKTRVADIQRQISSWGKGARFLFMSSVMLARPGVCTVSLVGERSDQPIWARKLTINPPASSAWQRFAAWSPVHALDANVSKVAAVVSTFDGASPIVSGTSEQDELWKGEIPGIVHADAPGLKLSIKDKRFAVDSGDSLMLDWPDENLMARWCVNGKPIVPIVSPESAQQASKGRQVNFTKHVEVGFGLPTDIGDVKPGDTVALQVMYSPGPITAVSADAHLIQTAHSRESKKTGHLLTPTVSNKLEFVLTQELLSLVRTPLPAASANQKSAAGAVAPPQ